MCVVMSLNSVCLYLRKRAKRKKGTINMHNLQKSKQLGSITHLSHTTITNRAMKHGENALTIPSTWFKAAQTITLKLRSQCVTRCNSVQEKKLILQQMHSGNLCMKEEVEVYHIISCMHLKCSECTEEKEEDRRQEAKL